MRRLLAAAIVIGSAFGVSAAIQGPDVSGRWTRDSISGGSSGNGRGAGWGPTVEIDATSGSLTIRPESGTSQRYKLDGSETSETLSSVPCARQTRIGKAVATDRTITITSWLVSQPGCAHGETDLFRPDDEETNPPAGSRPRVGPGQSSTTRTLESITVVSRQGDTLTVETTRGSAAGSSTTTTIYRK